MATTEGKGGYIRCGCGERFGSLEAYWDHKEMADHPDLGESFGPKPAYQGVARRGR